MMLTGLLVALAAVLGGDASETISASFQQGVDGYQGVVDTEIWALAGTTILESNSNASSDANNDGGESQVLLKFNDLVGPGAGGSRMFQMRAPMMVERSYEPATMKVSTWKKDMAIIAEFAEDVGCTVSVYALPENAAALEPARRAGFQAWEI